MDTIKISVSQLSKNDEIPGELLLLSDDSIEAIENNIKNGEIYVGKSSDTIVGSFILKAITHDTVEIMNIAVVESLQGKGIGTTLLNYIIDNVKQRGFKELLVGTCDRCEKEIEFYKKSGFIVSGIRKNFFLDKYKNAIFESGQQIIDMVLLKVRL